MFRVGPKGRPQAKQERKGKKLKKLVVGKRSGHTAPDVRR